MLVNLGSGLFVAADRIVEVSVDEDRDLVLIELNTGEKHIVLPREGEGIRAALGRIVKEVNVLLAASTGALTPNEIRKLLDLPVLGVVDPSF